MLQFIFRTPGTFHAPSHRLETSEVTAPLTYHRGQGRRKSFSINSHLSFAGAASWGYNSPELLAGQGFSAAREIPQGWAAGAAGVVGANSLHGSTEV